MRWSRVKGVSALAAVGILLAGVGLSASLSGQGTVPVQTPATANTEASPQPTPQASPTPAVAQTHSPPAFFVMIDPAHGGDDRGAVFAGNLAEKDVTLALARRLKTELQERGIFARLLRDTDITLSLEQRAENANEQHASVYVALHAGMPGQGVRVYAPSLASSAPASPSPASASLGRFLLWENAQADSLARSQELAQRITGELARKNLTAIQLTTPLRPLNNVTAPAIAVELAPNPDNVQDIMAQKFQTTVAAGIAVGISQLRAQWESQP
jgi:N-acetylmuramoyl-L-alanine amidase